MWVDFFAILCVTVLDYHQCRCVRIFAFCWCMYVVLCLQSVRMYVWCIVAVCVCFFWCPCFFEFEVFENVCFVYCVYYGVCSV